jgi:threonine dehydratase
VARAPGLPEVEEARRNLAGVALNTPLLEAPPLPGIPGGRLWLKLETLQRTGSFKIRGASNRMAHLSADQARRGVITASAGNHGQGVAYAARARGIPATIVMPKDASPSKVLATEAMGARVVLAGADYQEAWEVCQSLRDREGLTLVHPFDDPAVIAGQGTIGLEILESLPSVGTVVAGVGGGGLLAGLAVALHAVRPEVRLVGVQAAAAGSLKASLLAGAVLEGPPPSTFADGIATRKVGDLTFRILREHSVRAVEVSEGELARAIFLLLERAHLLTEGAGAAPLAALLAHPELLDENAPTVAVLSGGNLDAFLLDRILWAGLASDGRILHLRVPLRDRPGALAALLSTVAATGANVYTIRHDRESPTLPPGQASVELELEVRDPGQGERVLAALKEAHYAPEPTLGPSPRGPRQTTAGERP